MLLLKKSTQKTLFGSCDSGMFSDAKIWKLNGEMYWTAKYKEEGN
jgi:hypothetical protein